MMKTENEYKKEIMELIQEADSIAGGKHTSDKIYGVSHEKVKKICEIKLKITSILSEALHHKLHDKFLYFEGNYKGAPHGFLDNAPYDILIGLPTIFPNVMNRYGLTFYSGFVTRRYNKKGFHDYEIYNNMTYHNANFLDYNNAISYILDNSIDDLFNFFDAHIISKEKFIEMYKDFNSQSINNFENNLNQAQRLETEAYKIKNNL